MPNSRICEALEKLTHLLLTNGNREVFAGENCFTTITEPDEMMFHVLEKTKGFLVVNYAFISLQSDKICI